MPNALIPVCLDTIGYDKRYVLYPQGYVFNTKTNETMYMYGHSYRLRRSDGDYCTVALKTLYRQCYHKEYCLDTIPDLPGEEWRNVVVDKDVDATGYLASSLGRIKSLKRYEAVILKSSETISGYFRVSIGGKFFRIHRLVALTFIPNNDKSKDTVDHINGDITDNRVSNLQWMSRQENVRKSWAERKQDKECKKSAVTQCI